MAHPRVWGKTAALHRTIVSLLTGKKSTRSYVWFTLGANYNYPGRPLHKASNWSYFSVKQWNCFVNNGIKFLEPPVSNGSSVFEVGVGAGAFLKVIKDQYPSVQLSGIDLVKKAVAIANKVLPQSHFSVGNGLDLSAFNDNSYDHVIANFVITYLNNLEEAHKFLSEMVRIAKPGGSLMLTCIVEPGGRFKGSGNIYIPKTWWSSRNLKYSITSFQAMGQWEGCASQKDRYAVYLRKDQF